MTEYLKLTGVHENIDKSLAQDLFLLCNEFATRLIVQRQFEEAQILLEQALLLNQNMPQKQQSCLLANVACFYERQGDLTTAKLYQTNSVSQGGEGDNVNKAINFNNLSVMELQQGNYEAAIEAASQAYSLIEPDLLAKMNHESVTTLKQNLSFLEQLQVLLVSYFNYGMCQLKRAETDNELLKECQQSFEHAQIISKRYLGETHFFTQKLQRKLDRVAELIAKQQQQLQPLAMQIQGLKQQLQKNERRNIMKQHEQMLRNKQPDSSEFQEESKNHQVAQKRSHQRTLTHEIKSKPQEETERNSEQTRVEAEMDTKERERQGRELKRERELTEQRNRYQEEMEAVRKKMQEQEERLRKVQEEETRRMQQKLEERENELKARENKLKQEQLELERQKQLREQREAQLAKEEQELERQKAQQYLESQQKQSPRQNFSELRITDNSFTPTSSKFKDFNSKEENMFVKKDVNPSLLQVPKPDNQGGLTNLSQSFKTSQLSDEVRIPLHQQESSFASAISFSPLNAQQVQEASVTDRNSKPVVNHLQIQNADSQFALQVFMSPPLTSVDPPPKEFFSQREIEQILKEDSEQFDMSIVLKSGLIEKDLKTDPTQTKLATKIMHSGGKYIKVYCRGYFNEENEFSIKISAVCEDTSIEIISEELSYSMLEGICKLIIVREVLPYQTPLKLIKTFQDFCRICVFPFLLFLGPDDEPKQSEKSSLSLDDNSSLNRSVSLDPNQRQIELWGRAQGILASEPHIQFLDNPCTLALHHIHDKQFRISISSLDCEKANMMFIELELDAETFDKNFKWFEHEQFRKGSSVVNMESGEIALPSLKAVEGGVVDIIKSGLAAFEHYLRTEFGAKVQFSFLVYERTSLMHLLKVRQDPEHGNLIELWCARDEPAHKRIKFACKTHYTICLKKNTPERIERESYLEYIKIWTYFGLNKLDLTRTQLLWMAFMYLKTLYLNLPTIVMNREEEGDSDNEEHARIASKPIDCICAARKVITVKNRKVPATISLVGVEGKIYLGIKVTVLDPESVSEQGFFLTVDQADWERSDEEKSLIQTKQKVKQEVLFEHYKLPAWIKGEGGQMIFKKLQVKSRAEIKNTMSIGHDLESDSEDRVDKSGLSDYCLYWPSAYGPTVVDYLLKEPTYDDE